MDSLTLLTTGVADYPFGRDPCIAALGLSPRVLDHLDYARSQLRSLGERMEGVRSLEVDAQVRVMNQPDAPTPRNHQNAHRIAAMAFSEHPTFLADGACLDPEILSPLEVHSPSIMLNPHGFRLRAFIGDTPFETDYLPNYDLLARARLVFAGSREMPGRFRAYAMESPQDAAALLNGAPLWFLGPPSSMTEALDPDALAPLLESPVRDVRETAIRALADVKRRGPRRVR